MDFVDMIFGNSLWFCDWLKWPDPQCIYSKIMLLGLTQRPRELLDPTLLASSTSWGFHSAQATWSMQKQTIQCTTVQNSDLNFN